MDILQRIIKLRQERGWTEYQLSESSGISQSTISSWYSKGMLPSVGSLEKICNGFGITMSYFFAEEGDAVILTKEQRELLNNWDKLRPEAKQSLIHFLETI